MSKAKVFDITTAQLERRLEHEAAASDEQLTQHSITADMADGIEAIHQCLNLADFKEGPRAFVLMLADAAGSLSTEHVELFDEELAELENCSTRTVQRQRAAYMEETRRCHFTPVEVKEGDYDSDTKQHLPTSYKFHLTEFIEQTVTQARASSQWDETDRRAQRKAIKIAAEKNYGMIPDAPLQRRKKKRPRSAVAEIETCQKVILTKLERLKKMAAALPASRREQVLDAWCERMQAEIEALREIEFPQATDGRRVKGGSGQLVGYPPLAAVSDESPEEPEAGAAASATWERLEERLTTPAVRSVEIELHSAEWPPGQADELEEELTLEEERAAIMQYDGGLKRVEADALARGEIERRKDDQAGRPTGGDSAPSVGRDGPSARVSAREKLGRNWTLRRGE